jgi:hypothetical protein
MAFGSYGPQMPGLLGEEKPRNFGAGFQQFTQNNPNMLLALGMGLLAHRQNATQTPLSAIAPAAMAGGQMDYGINKDRQSEAKAAAATSASAKFLLSRGHNEEDVRRFVEMGIVGDVAKQEMAPKEAKTTDDITEFNFAKQNGFGGSFKDWLADGSGGDEYGLTPITGVDANGNTVLMAPSKSGALKVLDRPEGVESFSNGFEKIDTETEILVMDRRTGQVVQRIQKDLAGAASATAGGKAQADAAAGLPAAESDAETVLQQIKEIKEHPGRSAGTGKSRMLPWNRGWQGTDVADFDVRHTQLQGGAFLAAIQKMRGTGAISDVESKAATAAISRLSTSQSDAEYERALTELESIVARGVEVQRKKAGVPSSPSSGAARVRVYNPATGRIE